MDKPRHLSCSQYGAWMSVGHQGHSKQERPVRVWKKTSTRQLWEVRLGDSPEHSVYWEAFTKISTKVTFKQHWHQKLVPSVRQSVNVCPDVECWGTCVFGEVITWISLINMTTATPSSTNLFLKQGLMQPKIASNSFCSWRWPPTAGLPAFTSCVLGLQECTTAPRWRSAGDQT